MTDPKIKTAKHASESASWYAQDGSQVTEVNGKKCTLREARKLDLAPGQTAIRNCAYRHMLEVWKQEHCIRTAVGLTAQRGLGWTTSDEDVKALRRLSEEERGLAMDKGTEIHAAIQADLQGHAGILTGEQIRICVRVREILDGLTGNWIIDIKTKDGTQAELDELRTYPDHWMQLAATERALENMGPESNDWVSEHACVSQYGYGTKSDLCRDDPEGGPGFRHAILFVSRDHPGAMVFKDVPWDKIHKGWRMFKALLHFWQQERDYKPSWAEEVLS